MDLNYIAVENLPAGYLVLDVRDHCRIVKTNARVRACLGLNDEALEGRTIEDLKDYFDVDADWCRELMAQALAQDRGAEVTRYCPRQKKWFRILAGASEGRLLSLYLSDVTEERASVAWMRSLVEGAQDIVFFLSEDLVVENVITEKEADLFVPRDRLVGRSLEEVLEGGNLAALREGVAYAGTHEDKFRHEYASADQSRWFLAEIFAMATREKRGFVLSIRDITRQKKLEMALLARNEQYALAIQGSNDGIWDWNLKTDDLYLSPHWKRQLGYEDHELTNSFKTFYDLIVLEDRERVSRRVADYLEGRVESYGLVFRMVHKSGEVRWILARGEALRDEKGVPYRMAGSHTDITDQRRTVEALEDSEERLRQMAESIDDVFWLTDARTGRMLYVNPAYEKIWGQPVDRLYKREQSFTEAIVDEDLPGVTDHYRRYLEGEDFDMTYRVRTPGGEVRHIHAKSRPVHDKAGKVIRHVGIARDVTPLHRVEAEKAAIFDEYEQVFNGTQDSMFLVERTGEGELRYIRNNRAHRQSTGLSFEMIRGKTPRELAGEELGSRIEGNYRRCLEEKRPLRYEETLDLGGQKKTWLTTLTPILDEEKGAYIVGSSKDVTEENRAREDLARERLFFEETLKSVGDGVLIVDETGRITFANPAAEALSGWRGDQLLNRKVLKFFTSKDIDTSRPWLDLVTALKEQTGVTFEEDTHLRHATGRLLPIEATVSPIFTREALSGIVVVFRDMTRKNEEKRRIMDLGYRDPMTGLRNRRAYEMELSRLDRPEHYPLALVMADLNGLKIINDSFGHDLGDELILEAARVIETSCRRDEIICRIGGDEFVILLPATSEEEALQLVRRIKKRAEGIRIHAMELSISFGIGVKEGASLDMKRVFNQAEERMYREKLQHGRNYREKIMGHVVATLNEGIDNRQKHNEKLLKYSLQLARHRGLDQAALERLEKAVLIHDIGKITKIHEDNLYVLTDTEWCMTEREAETGYRILKAITEYHDVAEIIYEHRERFDGGGTPFGKRGEEISIEARIIALADYYDRMKRLKGLSDSEIKEKLAREETAGRRFDPDLVDLFFKEVLSKA